MRYNPAFWYFLHQATISFNFEKTIARAILLNIAKFLMLIRRNCAGLRIRIHFIRIRIQHFRLNTDPDPDPDPIRIQPGALMTKNWKKLQLKKNWIFLGSKTTIYLSLDLHKERPSYRRSLQISKEAIQHFKKWTLKKIFYFSGASLSSWIRIRILNPNPDPLTRLNPDPSRIRIRIRNPDCVSLPQDERETGL